MTDDSSRGECESDPSDAMAPDAIIVQTHEPAHTGASRCGAIILVRHGEPALSRKIKLNAAGYADWWARYETKGLVPGQRPPADLKAAARNAVIVSSTRLRAISSGQALADGRIFEQVPALIEAPLPPPNWPRWLKLAPRSWGFIARTWWWFFNQHAGQETRAEAELRAGQVATRLEALAGEGRDVLVIAHGFFNTLVGLALRRRGWRLVEDQGYSYWAARRFERN